MQYGKICKSLIQDLDHNNVPVLLYVILIIKINVSLLINKCTLSSYC